jgi:hypothetical protein
LKEFKPKAGLTSKRKAYKNDESIKITSRRGASSLRLKKPFFELS